MLGVQQISTRRIVRPGKGWLQEAGMDGSKGVEQEWTVQTLFETGPAVASSVNWGGGTGALKWSNSDPRE